jgi:hypothetical protein
MVSPARFVPGRSSFQWLTQLSSSASPRRNNPCTSVLPMNDKIALNVFLSYCGK